MKEITKLIACYIQAICNDYSKKDALMYAILETRPAIFIKHPAQIEFMAKRQIYDFANETPEKIRTIAFLLYCGRLNFDVITMDELHQATDYLDNIDKFFE